MRLVNNATHTHTHTHTLSLMLQRFEIDSENKAKKLVMWKLQSPHVRAFHVSNGAQLAVTCSKLASLGTTFTSERQWCLPMGLRGTHA